MKIKTTKLYNFIQKITMNGSINMILLESGEDGIFIKSKSLDNAGVGFGTLNSSAFDDYKSFGEIGLGDVGKLLRMLKTITSEKTDIQIQGNHFVINGADGDVWGLPIMEKAFVDNYLEEIPKINFDDGVNIKSSIFKKSLVNKSIVNSSFINVQVKDNFLSINTNNEQSEYGIVKEECKYNDFKSVFGEVMDATISVLGNKVNMSCKDNYPIRFVEQTSDYSVSLVIAPIDNEEIERNKTKEVEEVKSEVEEVEKDGGTEAV